MLAIQYLPLTNEIAVLSGQTFLQSLPFNRVHSLDGDLAALCNDARNNPSLTFAVPNVSFAKGLRSRNYGRHGIQQ